MRENSNLTTPLEDMGLSVRTYNCLKRAGINTLGDLSRRTADDLMKLRNLGQRSLREIIDACKRYGVVIQESAGTNKEKPKETVESRALTIAAKVLQSAGACRYDDFSKCHKVHIGEKTCNKCIRSWLLSKARKELQNSWETAE